MRQEIRQLSNEIIDEFFNNVRLPHEIESLGVYGAKEIIQEFLENNEFGLAIDHLEYFIKEYNLKLNPSQLSRMDLISEKFK